MDDYCLFRNNDRLLDTGDITLEQPGRHSLHCLVDVSVCVEGPFYILGDPETPGTLYTVDYILDDPGRLALLDMARNAGMKGGGCSTCLADEGLRRGYRAEVIGTVESLETSPVRLKFVSAQTSNELTEICSGFENGRSNAPMVASLSPMRPPTSKPSTSLPTIAPTKGTTAPTVFPTSSTLQPVRQPTPLPMDVSVPSQSPVLRPFPTPIDMSLNSTDLPATTMPAITTSAPTVSPTMTPSTSSAIVQPVTTTASPTAGQITLTSLNKTMSPSAMTTPDSNTVNFTMVPNDTNPPSLSPISTMSDDASLGATYHRSCQHVKRETHTPHCRSKCHVVDRTNHSCLALDWHRCHCYGQLLKIVCVKCVV